MSCQQIMLLELEILSFLRMEFSFSGDTIDIPHSIRAAQLSENWWLTIKMTLFENRQKVLVEHENISRLFFVGVAFSQIWTISTKKINICIHVGFVLA